MIVGLNVSLIYFLSTLQTDVIPVIILSTCLGLALMLILLTYVVRARQISLFLERQSNEPVTIKISEESIFCASKIGNTEFYWDYFDGLLKLQNVWLVTYAKKRAYITLPKSELSKECKELLERKLLTS